MLDFDPDGEPTEDGDLRLHVAFNEAENRQLQDTMAILGLEKRADVIHYAVRLANWSAWRQDIGCAVVLYDPETGDADLLPLEVLDEKPSDPDKQISIRPQQKVSVYDEGKTSVLPLNIDPHSIDMIDKLVERHQAQSRAAIVARSVELFQRVLVPMIDGQQLVAVDQNDRMFEPEFGWNSLLKLGRPGGIGGPDNTPK